MVENKQLRRPTNAIESKDGERRREREREKQKKAKKTESRPIVAGNKKQIGDGGKGPIQQAAAPIDSNHSTTRMAKNETLEERRTSSTQTERKKRIVG